MKKKYYIILLLFIVAFSIIIGKRNTIKINFFDKEEYLISKKNINDFELSGNITLHKNSTVPIFIFRKNANKGYKISITDNQINISGGLIKNIKKKLNYKKYKKYSFKLISDGNQFKFFFDNHEILKFQDGSFRQGKIKILQNKNFLTFQKLDLLKIDTKLTPAALNQRQALQSFNLKDNLKIKLIAGDKLVQNPISLKYNFNGHQAWIVEMTGFMRSQEEGLLDKPTTGNIILLSDTNKDGIFDHRKEFLKNISMPRAVIPYNKGILYADQDNLYYVKNDNGKPKKQIIVDKNYSGTYNPEHDSNGLLLSIDNWIYSAKFNIRYKQVNGLWLKEKTFLRGQWGMSQDKYGRLFYTQNSTPVLADILLPNMFISQENNFTKYAKKYYNRSFAPKQVFPVINNYVNRGYLEKSLDEKGILKKATAISGGHIYGGHNLPEKYHNNFFSTEPAGNLIQALKISDINNSYKAVNFFNQSEFLTSYDRLFRPVDALTAPNGSLTIIDFYRGLIQHNIFLTDYLKKLTLNEGLEKVIDLGRIYQIYDPKRPLDKVEDLSQYSPKQLISFLGHHNSWWRITAQYLIVQSQNKAIAPQLIKNFFRNKNNQLAKIHTIWTLEGLNLLNEKIITQYLKDEHNSQWVKNHLFHSLRSKKILQNKELFLQVLKTIEKKDISSFYALQLLSKFNKTYQKKIFIKKALEIKKNKEKLAILLLNLNKNTLKQKYNLKWENFFPSKKNIPLNLNQKQKLIIKAGKKAFIQCSFCHGAYGQGITGLAPTLAKSNWVLGNKNRLIAIILKGLSGPIIVNDKTYSGGIMPPFENLYNDKKIADVLSFIRNNSWGNKASFISEKDVKTIRQKLKLQKESFTQKTLDSTFKKYQNLNNKSNWQIFPKMKVKFINDQIHLYPSKLTNSKKDKVTHYHLISKKEYSDFILQAQVFVEKPKNGQTNFGNSGVFVRTEKKGDFRLKGYQYEVDPSPRKFSGGLYDQSRRKWMVPKYTYKLKKGTKYTPTEPEAIAYQKKFGEIYQPGKWNTIKIICRGNNLQFFLNDIQTVNINDSLSSKGFIGLQHHGEKNKIYKYKNIRILDLNTK